MRSPVYLLAALSLLGSGCSGRQASEAGSAAATDSSGVTPASALISQLRDISGEGKTLFGHHDDPVYGHTWKWEHGRSDVMEVTGKYPAMMSWDLGGIEKGDSVNLDGVPFERIRQEVRLQHERGGLNTFSWHLCNPVNGADSWQVSDSTIVGKIARDSVYAHAYEEQVRRAAEFFNSLTDSQGNRIGVIFRPWHEHTGGWFWWGAPLCSPDDYRNLWRSMRRVMDSEGVDNVVYAYSPDRVGSMDQYMERYPGDDLVDIVGIDIYHFGKEEGLEEYRRSVSFGLDIVDTVARTHNKIPAFTETGLEGVPMAQWWTEVLLPLLKAHPVAYVVVWRNAWDKPTHFYAPYPGQASEESFKAFCADSTIVFVSK